MQIVIIDPAPGKLLTFIIWDETGRFWKVCWTVKQYENEDKTSVWNGQKTNLETVFNAIDWTQVLTTCQNRDYGRQQGRFDSYAQHSVAPKFQLPPGAPSRLQVEPDPDDTLHPPLTDSYTSSPDTQGGRFIKRKVLRYLFNETNWLCLIVWEPKY